VPSRTGFLDYILNDTTALSNNDGNAQHNGTHHKAESTIVSINVSKGDTCYCFTVCHYAECRYAEGRGTVLVISLHTHSQVTLKTTLRHSANDIQHNVTQHEGLVFDTQQLSITEHSAQQCYALCLV